MLIAFEGPDNTGKSTSAKNLTSFDENLYNATKASHAHATVAMGGDAGLIQTFDRIDWLTHMVYRLALPDRDWADERPRTVFAMPDTHLVFKIHHPQYADFLADEVVSTPIALVNPMYYYFADFFMHLNRQREYSLFKSVTILEVINDQASGNYSFTLAAHDSPGLDWGSQYEKLVNSDETLLDFLHYVDQHTLV